MAKLVVPVLSSIFFVCVKSSHLMAVVVLVTALVWIIRGHLIAVLPLRGIVRVLIGVLILHNPNGFIIVEVGWFLGGSLCGPLRGVVVGGVVVFFSDGAFGAVVYRVVVPGEREGSGTSWGLDNLFVSFAVEVSVIGYVLVEHFQEIIWYLNATQLYIQTPTTLLFISEIDQKASMRALEKITIILAIESLGFLKRWIRPRRQISIQMIRLLLLEYWHHLKLRMIQVSSY